MEFFNSWCKIFTISRQQSSWLMSWKTLKNIEADTKNTNGMTSYSWWLTLLKRRKKALMRSKMTVPTVNQEKHLLQVNTTALLLGATQCGRHVRRFWKNQLAVEECTVTRPIRQQLSQVLPWQPFILQSNHLWRGLLWTMSSVTRLV